MQKTKWMIFLAAFSLVAAACGDDEPTAPATTVAPVTTKAPVTTTQPPATTQGPATTTQPPARSIEATAASISVDGDPSDWEAIDGLELTLEPIKGFEVESKSATVKTAHDDEFLYVLFTVDDDYNWSAEDAHLSAATAVMWSVESGAGAHMGTEDLAGEGPSAGMVDIWHWELECGLGEEQGGRIHPPGDGSPGNDSGCNFDDEFATEPEERFDDGDPEGPAGTGAENSLLGVFTHTNPTADGSGTWVFEMSRPLQTGDSQDGQFKVGSTAQLALAYWDPDFSPAGWEDEGHAQSSNQGWIEVVF